MWVVGDVAAGGSTAGVAEHWDGRRWMQTSFPALLSLQQVSASGPHDVWAAGIDRNFDAVIERFDGISWTRFAAQPPLTSRDGINALLARSDDDVWAFGVRLTAAGAAPISAHWDGQTWRLVGSRLARSPWSVLLAAAPGRDGDVWLASVDVDVATLTMRGFAGHVVGGRITRVSLPSVPDEDVADHRDHRDPLRRHRRRRLDRQLRPGRGLPLLRGAARHDLAAGRRPQPERAVRDLRCGGLGRRHVVDRRDGRGRRAGHGPVRAAGGRGVVATAGAE